MMSFHMSLLVIEHRKCDISFSISDGTYTVVNIDYIVNALEFYASLLLDQPYCSSVKDIKDKNKRETTQSREEIISQGYQPCKRCNP